MVSFEKDKYERLIDSSSLFSLDKEKERTAYKREALKMVEYLYGYLMSVNKSKYESYGLEIVDTAKRCIENYNSEAGRFLNYFASAWKQTYGHIVGNEIVQDTYKGIHFTEAEERNFKKYMRLAHSMGVNTDSPEFDIRVAEAMGISITEIDALKKMISVKPVSGTFINEEGEEFSILDQIDSGEYTGEEIFHLENAKDFLDLLELVYNELQERQKPMIAMLITTKIAVHVNDDTELLEYARQKAYYDDDIFIESIQRGEQIQAKEIAGKCGVLEASTSRTWKTFKDKVIAGNSRRK